MGGGDISGNRADDANKANGYHNDVTSFKFVKTLHFMLDILPILIQLSKTFQKDDLLVFQASDLVTRTIMELTCLGGVPGPNMLEFKELYNTDTHEYCGVKLNHYSNSILSYTDDTDIQNFIADAISYIERRFENLESELLSLFKIFDFRQ